MKKLGILSVLLVLVLASVAFAAAPTVDIQVRGVAVDADDADVGTVVQFNAVTGDADGDAVNTFLWNIKQGASVVATYNIVNPTHTFAARGIFTVEVTATDAAEEVSDLDTVTITARQADLRIKDQVSGAEVSEVKLSAEDGNAIAYNLVKLVNEGNKDLNGLKVRAVFDTNKDGVINALDVENRLEDKNADAITMVFNPAANIDVLKNDAGNVLDEVAVRLTMNIADGFDVNDYKVGTLQVLDALNVVVKEIPFKVRAGEAFCFVGPQQASRLSIDVKNPEDDDELNLGEKFKVQIDVENNANTDEDFIVEAFLYNINKGNKVDRFKTNDQSIDSDEEESFNFEMNMDADEIDDDKDKVVLFLKVFVDGKEETFCAEKEVKIDLKQEDQDVRFKELALLPQTAVCGAPIEARVTVRNFGSEDTDAVVKLKNQELGLDLRSPSFNLEQLQGDDEDGEDSRTLRFNFILPENVKAGQYNIEATASFESKDNSITQTLTVAECKKGEAPKAEEQPKAPAVVVTTTTPAQPTVQAQQPSVQQPTVAPTVFTQRDIFDVFNRDKTPTALWIALDLVLVLLIVIVVYMVVNKRKR